MRVLFTKALLGGVACALAASPAWARVYHITRVQVSHVTSKDASYGKVWTGRLTYDVSSEKKTVWTWLEVSTDDGKTWSHGKAQAIGHVGTIEPGAARKILWLVDGGDAKSFRFRVRVNDDPAFYELHKTEALDTTVDSEDECPKPIPEVDPYTTLEMMINRRCHGHDLTQIGKYKYEMPGLDFKATVSTGKQLIVGMADSPRPASKGYRPNPDLKFRATYLKVGDMEFAVISKNSIRNLVEVVEAEKAAIRKELGIPKEHILINWCHVHYSDNGELGAAESAAALRKAKERARPARMAVVRLHTGPGYNYYRQGASHGYTDGPIDDNLWAFLFRDSDDKPVGSWIRFTGHGAGAKGRLSLEMEKRFGGACAFLNGHAGNVDAAGARFKGKYDPKPIVDMVLKAAKDAKYENVTQLGVASAWTKYYGVPTLIQCARLGDYALPAYYAEPPVEQALVTSALLSCDRTMVIGYANGRAGPGGGYYSWSKTTGIQRPRVLRMTQETVRAANILDLMLKGRAAGRPSGRGGS